MSPVRADGLPRPGAAARDGVALTTARQRKQWTYPELSGRHRRCRLVVLVDVGRWKPVVSCVHSPGTALGRSHHSHAGEWNRHGGCGGGPSFRALLLDFVSGGLLGRGWG